MSEVVDLAHKRPPVTYMVTITQHWDGRVEAFVHNVADDDRSRASVTDALRRVVEARLGKQVGHAADGMLAQMLALIDSAMGTTVEKPAQINVVPDELAAWASAVEEYERARFPLNHGRG